MKTLVAYATRHGATAGIAERIAATLTESGRPAEARPVEEVTSVDGYEAVILGGAAYMFHWLKPAVKFARQHRAALASRPVWLFSSGPLGTDMVDEDGKDVLQTTRPKEFDELTELLHPAVSTSSSAPTTRTPHPSAWLSAWSGSCRRLGAACPPVTSGTGQPSTRGRGGSPRP